MENVTLGQIVQLLAFIVALGGGVTGVVALIKKPFKRRDDELKKWIAITIKTEVEPIKDKLDEVTADLKKVDLNSCKNYLVRYLSDVEQGNQVDEIEKERFYEQFEHYEKVGGNSYIHAKVEKLRQKGVL